MRKLPRALLAGGLGFAVSLLAACGSSSGLLSSNQAANLSNNLDAVSSAVSGHNCAAVDTASRKLAGAVASLPPTVNSTVSANLSQGVSTVSQLAAKACHQTTTSSTSTTVTTSSTHTTSSSAPTSSTSSTSTTSSLTSTSTSATSTTTSGSTSSGPSGGGSLIPGGGTGTSGGGGGNGNGY